MPMNKLDINSWWRLWKRGETSFWPKRVSGDLVLPTAVFVVWHHFYPACVER